MKELTLFFCYAGEILIERKKKIASQPGNAIEFIVYLEVNYLII